MGIIRNTTDRLAQLGLSLPTPPQPVANYVPFKIINVSSTPDLFDTFKHVPQVGRLLYVSGMLPIQNGELFVKGKLGAEVSLEDAVTCAQICTLNALGWASKALQGELDRILEVVQLRGLVASTPEFYDQPKVINGSSDLLVEILGDDGKHTRVVTGCVALPMNAPVEIDFLFSLR
jgi:enamine deaminase RidA (YjgF/YER057c/UK114 family)